MKFGVITFPGSNCDADMIYVLENKMKAKVEKLWHKDEDLKGVDMVILPGGFSYGDYLRSGAIARFSPIMTSVIKFAKKGGYVFGVCNGFQILCESGLLPGTLLHNDSRKFICKNVHIKSASKSSILTKYIPEQQVLKIPIAHGEGKYFNHADEIKKLQDQDQILFNYCDETGNVTPEANPNGATLNIAGICNEQRNVFGMMPHPERASDTVLRNDDGKYLFESLLKSTQ